MLNPSTCAKAVFCVRASNNLAQCVGNYAHVLNSPTSSHATPSKRKRCALIAVAATIRIDHGEGCEGSRRGHPEGCKKTECFVSQLCILPRSWVPEVGFFLDCDADRCVTPQGQFPKSCEFGHGHVDEHPECARRRQQKPPPSWSSVAPPQTRAKRLNTVTPAIAVRSPFCNDFLIFPTFTFSILLNIFIFVEKSYFRFSHLFSFAFWLVFFLSLLLF